MAGLVTKVEFRNVSSMNIHHPLPEAGYDLPVRASFFGPRLATTGLLSYITFAHNNLCPSLKLFPEHLEYRIIFKSTKRYSEIKGAEIRPHPLGFLFGEVFQLRLQFKNSWWEIVFVFNSDMETSIISLLENLNIPVIKTKSGSRKDNL
jgi:hypothetical protein